MPWILVFMSYLIPGFLLFIVIVLEGDPERTRVKVATPRPSNMGGSRPVTRR
jgi:hypothetical protein